jgi:hypothetical protein
VPSELWKKGTDEIIERLKKEGVTIGDGEKALLEVFVKVRDGFGLRVIDRIPTSPEDSKKKIWGLEGKELSMLHRGLKAILEDDGRFVFEDGREKNLYIPAQREEFFKEKNNRKGREDNGYVTIQDGMRYQGIPIEIQYRSERAHDEAELGGAAHDRYKDYFKSRNGEDELPDASPVFTDINEIRHVGKDGTVADFLAEYYRKSVDPALAFSTSSIKIIRPLHYFDPELIPAPLNNDFSAPLMPGDRVVCTMDTELRYDPRQREAMIAACKLRDSSELLKSLHIDLAHNEATRAGGRRNSPPSSYEI